MSRVYPFGEPGALRVFRLAEKTTSRQDGWLMVQLEDAGILALARGSGLSDEAAARSVMAQAHRSQHYHKIVAAFLIEDGKTKWTVEDAESNAEFIADVSDPEQKETLMGIFVGALQGFFF